MRLGVRNQRVRSPPIVDWQNRYLCAPALSSNQLKDICQEIGCNYSGSIFVLKSNITAHLLAENIRLTPVDKFYSAWKD